MSERIVFHLDDLRKYYGTHEVLKGITLSFLEGAKIGLIGANGAGKSTLLRIIAGVDKEFEGVARAAEGLTAGYLEQEPPLNDEHTVAESVAEGGGGRVWRWWRVKGQGWRRWWWGGGWWRCWMGDGRAADAHPTSART
jgi:ABC-type Mn2+/Zn2+ transport system ATPase subunit